MIQSSSTQKYNVSQLCTAFGHTRQAFYKPRVSLAYENEIRIELVKKIFKCRKVRPTAGCRYIYDELPEDWPWGRDKTEHALFDMGFRVRYPNNTIRTTKPGSKVFSNLILGLKIKAINKVWQADLTYFFTQNGKTCYLILITDVYSQLIVGCGAYESYPASVVLEVLQRAIKKRGGTNIKGLIHHSDRGSQYGSDLYQKELKRYHILPSMCKYSWENPYAEKTNDLIKNGYLVAWAPKNIKELRNFLNKAVNNHNKYQRKQKLGKLSPEQFEKQLLKNNDTKACVLNLKPTEQWDYVLDKKNKIAYQQNQKVMSLPRDPLVLN
jgi:putative transposase